MQQKRVKYVLLVALMSFLVTGCLNFGGRGPTSPSPSANIHDLLDDYVRYAQAGEWDALAGLYTYPMTLVMKGTEGIDLDELDLEPGEECDKDAFIECHEIELATEVNSFLAENGLLGAVTVEDVNVETTGDPVDTVHLSIELRIETRDAAAIVVPAAILDLDSDEEDDDSAFTIPPGDVVISGGGDTREVAFPLIYTSDDEEMTFWVTFTVVRGPSGWKIQAHEHHVSFVENEPI